MAPIFTSTTMESAPTALKPITVDSAQPERNKPAPAQIQVLGKTKTGKTLKIRQYPTFDSLEEERLYRKQHLAAAFRIFADRGFDEGVAGHISVRDPILTDHFCEFKPCPAPQTNSKSGKLMLDSLQG
jgi:hypothetical protein